MRVDCKILETELGKIVGDLKKLGARKIVLFGSLARGNPRLMSDIDLIAIFKDNDRFKTRMQKIYSEIEANEQEFERLKDRSFFRRIAKEGKVLFEADD